MRTLTTSTAGALLAAMAVAGPATADPIVPIPMWVKVNHVSNGFDACAYGTATSSTNAWAMKITGGRGNGSTLNETVLSFQQSFSHCIRVLKNGTTAGAFLVTLSYGGSTPDVAGTFAGWAYWAPGQPDQSGDTGLELLHP